MRKCISVSFFLRLYLSHRLPLASIPWAQQTTGSVHVANYVEIKLKLRNVTIRGNSISRYRERALRRHFGSSARGNGGGERERGKRNGVHSEEGINLPGEREALSNSRACVISMCPFIYSSMLIILTRMYTGIIALFMHP